MEMKELWERACALMESEMNRIVYTTWIANNLTVMALEEDTLILRITMENMQRQLILILNKVDLMYLVVRDRDYVLQEPCLRSQRYLF